VGDDLDLAVGVGDLDGVAEVAGAALDLDLLVEELLEREDVEDLVAGGLLGVDDELREAAGGQRAVSRCLYMLAAVSMTRSAEDRSSGGLPCASPSAACRTSSASREFDLAYCFTP
jgi:hypothetical protein